MRINFGDYQLHHDDYTKFITLIKTAQLSRFCLFYVEKSGYQKFEVIRC